MLQRGRFAPDEQAVIGPSGRVALSPTESRLLAYFAANPGKALTYRTLLTEVWGYSERVESRTVYATVNRLRQKIELDPSQPRHIFAVPGVGYRFEQLDVAEPIPQDRDALVGRAAELTALEAALAAGRVITLLGPGGIGKTRLAREYLRRHPGCFCDLSDVRDEPGVAVAVGRALGIQLLPGDPVVQVGGTLGERLVVLDNAEPAAAATAAVVAAWSSASSARFLVTSRVPLGLADEARLVIPPLATPEGADAAGDAVELFLLRARAVRADFELRDDNRADVAALVRMLDGLPLAIELAAARTAVLSAGKLRERLSDRFAVLKTTRADRPERHTTLWATIAGSWDLLTPPERAALAACSVFAGGFTFDAAEAVMGLEPDASALDVLQSLVDHNLLFARAAGGDVRFGLLESIRDFASHYADEDAERRHGAWFARLGDEDTIAALSRHGGLPRHRMLMLDLDNLVVAARRAVARGDAAVAAGAALAAWAVFEVQGPFSAGISLLDAALTLDPAPPLRARLLLAVGDARRRAGEMQAARDVLAEAIAAARDAGLPGLEALGRSIVGDELRSRGDLDSARTWLVEAARLAEIAGDPIVHVSVGNRLGVLDLVSGRTADASRRLEEALAEARRIGHRRLEGAIYSTLAVLSSRAGDVDEATRSYEAAIAVGRETGDRRVQGHALTNLATTLLNSGREEEALVALEEALRLAIEIGNRLSEADTRKNLAVLHGLAGRLVYAKRGFHEALRLARSLDSATLDTDCLRGLAICELEDGDPSAALRYLEEATVRAGADQHWLGLIGIELSKAHLALGAVGEAEAAAERAIDVLDRIGSRVDAAQARAALAAVHREVGRLEDARRLLSDAATTLGTARKVRQHARMLCDLGRVDLALGDAEAARAALARARSVCRPEDRTSLLGRAVALLEAALG